MRRAGVAAVAGLALFVVPAEAAHFPANVRDAGLSPTGQAAAPRTIGGPCTEAASKSMPEGEGHDHTDLSQHRFRCRMRQVFFDSLTDELGARDDIVLGEMDVKNGLAAVAVTFPESGVVLFDVKKPAKPQFLSWYRGSECEQALMDVNCGAFVDISPAGDVVYLSVQSLSIVPGGLPQPGVRPVSAPGVELIDIRDRSNPQLLTVYPVLSEGGVHTVRSHVIPEDPDDDGPRDPGEFVFSLANGVGIDIARVTRSGDGISIEPWNFITLGEGGVHDTFIQNDPLTHRTYLYLAGGFATGFYVFDVTDPLAIETVAEWDLTPECTEDWYAHTIDVAIRNERRYVTLPSEMFDQGAMYEEETAAGCGNVIGNGDRAGPLWIVDATNWDKLGRFYFSGEGEDDTPEDLVKKSKKALRATWLNPAGRAGGNLIFSPHNQQIVRNRIYLSHYHGGVYVLNARKVFNGRRKAPVEVGYIVPNSAPTRPIFEPAIQPVDPFFTEHLSWRPSIWDAYWYKRHVLAADMVGGFYSLQWRGDRPKRKRR
jgi:hypothetical protein